MNKISVLIPNLKIGGAEKVIVTLLNYLSLNNDIKIELILLNKEGDLIFDLNENVNIVDFNIKNMKKDFFGLFKLMKYLRKEKPTSLLCVMWPLTIIGVLSKILTFSKVKIIVSDHTTFSKTPWIKNRFKKLIFRLSVFFIYPFASHRLNVSNQASRDLEKLGFLKYGSVETIYNPIKVSNLIRKNTEKKIFNVITVGSLKWAKNHELLLSAFKLVVNKNKNFRLTIVGDGGRKKELIELSNKLELSDYVFFVGQKCSKDLESIYLESDCFVLSSHYEGFSMVIVEAMNYGVPVISVDCDFGPKEILRNGMYGVLVPNYNSEALANAILDKYDFDDDLNFIKKRASDFSVEIIGEKYLKLLK